MSLLDELHLMNCAAKALSAASVRDADMRAAFCDADEQFAAWIVIGSATRASHPRPQAAESPPLPFGDRR